MKFKIIMVAFIAAFLAGCASEPLKAPCDQYATFCGTKTKINQW